MYGQHSVDCLLLWRFLQVDLCGHATLASAHLLFASGLVEGDTAIFHTRSGVLKAIKVSGYPEYEEEPVGEEISVAEQGKPGSKGVIRLDFPLSPPTACDDASLLSEALGGVEVKWVGMSSVGDYLVRVLQLCMQMCIACNPAVHYFILCSLVFYTVLSLSLSSSEKRRSVFYFKFTSALLLAIALN
jgi:hypothetical protein